MLCEPPERLEEAVGSRSYLTQGNANLPKAQKLGSSEFSTRWQPGKGRGRQRPVSAAQGGLGESLFWVGTGPGLFLDSSRL